jgi:hypothetical protein
MTLMTDYVFEIIERGKIRPETKVLTIANQRYLWGSVEALALSMAGWQGAFIRVKNLQGDTLVRAGISTALASIESCPAECPLKREQKHFLASGRHSLPVHSLLVDCALSKATLAA